MNDYVDLALKFIGVHYVWGGNNPLSGLDCSGMVCECLRSFGYIGKADHSASSLYFHLLAAGWVHGVGRGSVLFFGPNTDNINHIAFGLNDKLMVESGGGDRNTINKKEAEKIGAYVRIRPIINRRDLVASLVPGGLK